MKNFLGKNFMRGFLSVIWSFFTMAYLSAISFYSIPEANTRIVDTILGFLLGTVIAGAIFAFYFATTQGSSEKNEMLRDSQPINPATTRSIKMEVQSPETDTPDKKSDG